MMELSHWLPVLLVDIGLTPPASQRPHGQILQPSVLDLAADFSKKVFQRPETTIWVCTEVVGVEPNVEQGAHANGVPKSASNQR